MAKNLVGKDLSKIALPVILNEPATVLQKAAESCFEQSKTFTKVSYMHESSTERLLYLAAANAGYYEQMIGRLGKPFNPMLGETYEYIAPDFRYMAETVSHHPPVFALSYEGQNFKNTAISASHLKFTGKSINVTDKYPSKVQIDVQMPDDSKVTETYAFNRPMMVIGNVITNGGPGDRRPSLGRRGRGKGPSCGGTRRNMGHQ